jgi:hypothetical protein
LSDKAAAAPSEITRRIAFPIEMILRRSRGRASGPPLLLALCFVAAAVGCGRTELFGARAHCNPGDTVCQQMTGSAGSGGQSGFAGSTGMAGHTGMAGQTGMAGHAGQTGMAGHTGIGGQTGMAGSTGAAGMAGFGGTGGMAGGPVTCQQMRENCTNNKDDNCNGLVDCADPGCFGDKACSKPGQEICNNGLDDDGNGLIDCADPACKGSISCRPAMGVEICNNGIDDNGDGLVDCADPQCTTFPGCLTLNCSPDVDFGTLAAHGSSVTKSIDTTGSTRSFVTCATPGGTARVARFTLTQTADVRLDFSQATGTAHVVSLFRAGASQTCDRNPVTCVNAGDMPTDTQTFSGLQAGTYWLIVQSYPMTQGATTVTLSTGNMSMPEICNNGIDDDGNGLVDCQDQACVNAPNCVAFECKPDATIGALVVGDPAKSVRVDLTRAPDRYRPLCAGKTPGGDAAISLTLAQAGGIEIAFMQTGHTIFSLFKQGAAGTACDNSDNQVGCSPEDDPGGAVAFSDLPAGQYVLIFKATSASSSGMADPGVLNLRISAFQNRKQEICNNGIDDDGNGLIDCQDPACFGIGGCAAPACTPDQDLGAISWGTMKSAMVDTRGAPDLYQTSCGKGNGKERVLRLELTQPMALGVDCTQTGSNVIALSQQLAPLDTCDAHELGCADPAVLPFGCGYSIPDLQPGTYNVIIQAFQAGSEGTVSITFTGMQEIVREICDNGIDDDMDGFTDCADRKCVTSPHCEMFACRPDDDFGLLPLDGSVKTVVVQTMGAGDNETHTMCVSAPGGQDADVDFQLPATADVTLQWAQIGNHDFALYSDDGKLLSCEGGTSFACVSSGGAVTGATTFSALPAGSYHLVIDADKPGAEGGVAVRLSGKASP